MPERFRDCTVLDVGSLDVNGNNRYLFSGNYHYIGLDMGPGKNVDVVCMVHNYSSRDPFDVVISTECFEHDPYWKESLENCVKLVRSGGLLLFTCAAPGRPEHGTQRSGTPQDAPHVIERFGDYYRPLDTEDIQITIDPYNLFERYELSEMLGDLRFWGIKK